MEAQEKEEKPILWKVLLITGFIFIGNIAFFAYRYKNNFTAYAISDGIAKTYTEISSLSKILFIVQWVFIFLILVFVLIRDIKVKSRGKDISEIRTRKISGKSSTDLDTLYNILQEKKKLKLSTISKAFNINEEKAMDWCRILESGNLAVIDYPGVGEPVIKLQNLS